MSSVAVEVIQSKENWNRYVQCSGGSHTKQEKLKQVCPTRWWESYKARKTGIGMSNAAVGVIQSKKNWNRYVQRSGGSHTKQEKLK